MAWYDPLLPIISPPLFIAKTIYDRATAPAAAPSTVFPGPQPDIIPGGAFAPATTPSGGGGGFPPVIINFPPPVLPEMPPMLAPSGGGGIDTATIVIISLVAVGIVIVAVFVK